MGSRKTRENCTSKPMTGMIEIAHFTSDVTNAMNPIRADKNRKQNKIRNCMRRQSEATHSPFMLNGLHVTD